MDTPLSEVLDVVTVGDVINGLNWLLLSLLKVQGLVLLIVLGVGAFCWLVRAAFWRDYLSRKGRQP